MRIVLLGPPGAGKGTQSVRLAHRLQVCHLSTGEMLRQACDEKTALGLQAAQFMQQGQLVPDAMVEALVLERLAEPECNKGCVLDGFPRTLPQAINLDKWLNDQGHNPLIVLELSVPKEELFERLAKRGREDDGREIVAERLEQYKEKTRPLTDYYEKKGVLELVDGHGTPDEVFDRIVRIVENRTKP